MMTLQKNDRPLFTIVTISYNQADFVRETVESILSQDFSDYEYIIWDGVSTDGSVEILQSYLNHPKVRLVIQSDLGPADALSKAFAMASGNYYVYVNSDDTLLPSALKSMSESILDNPSTVLCGSGLFTDELSQPIHPIYSDRFIFPLAVFGQCLIVQPATIIPASLYKQTSGFNSNNLCNWDHELLLDLHRSGATFKAVPQRWSTYRLHQHSITSSKKLALLHGGYRHAVVNKFYPYLAMNNSLYNFALLFFWFLAKLIYPKKAVLAFCRHLFSSSHASKI